MLLVLMYGIYYTSFGAFIVLYCEKFPAAPDSFFIAPYVSLSIPQVTDISFQKKTWPKRAHRNVLCLYCEYCCADLLFDLSTEL